MNPRTTTPTTPARRRLASLTLGAMVGAAATSGCGGTGSNPDGGHATSLGFSPSNTDLTGLDLSAIGDVDFTGSTCAIQSESQGFDCGDTALSAFKIVTQPGGIRVAVYVARSFRVEPNVVLTVSGALPVILIALDRIDVLGTISVAASGYTSSAGGFAQEMNVMPGGGPGGGGAGTTSSAGGGGSYCGLGAAGAVENGAASMGGVAYGTAALVPLTGGSSGGSGGGGGAGGGAIQLVAGNVVNVAAGGVISAGGGGGSGGGTNQQEASGGGSGGAILIEAATVTVAGTLAANGGGGGQGGGGDNGRDATPTVAAAAGGDDPGHPSPGGAGSSATSTGGVAGMDTAGSSAGGGGGGAGWVRINSRAGQATLAGATLSPAATTMCLTQGTLHP